MATMTAILMAGTPHPYDGGLWGNFRMLALQEGSRADWVWLQGALGRDTPIPAPPGKMLEPALAALSADKPPEKWVLILFEGCGLQADACARVLGAQGLPFELLTTTAQMAPPSPFGEKNPSEEG